ncbi:MAG: hypothetical protein M3680_34720, partial [Myxococcota bacterium]|nr:hypothetical protein [Myxococcota bacterium]
AALAAIVREVSDRPVELADGLEAATALARAHGATILIAGSLFLVGEARVRYLGAPADPYLVSDPAARAR